MKINIKRKPKQLGVELKRKPQFVIFTDKDGTIDLGDPKFNGILQSINSMGGMIIPTTGRTVGDIIESLKKKNIKVPDIVVGDNGANIYSYKESKFISKMLLEHDKVMQIIKQFIKNGGNSDLIRYTDGSTIFASNSNEVRKYYKNSKVAVFSENINNTINETLEITKITLAGTKEEMQELSEYIKKLGYWTDMGATKFPTGERGNYRLDIAQNDINKGQAVKKIVNEKAQPQYGYICVGNGENDIPMFKQAIDDGMIAAIMKSAPAEIIEEIREYARGKQGKVMIIPENKNLANEFLLKVSKIFESKMKAEQAAERRGAKRKGRLPHVPRVEQTPLPRRSRTFSAGRGRTSGKGGRYL